MVLGGSRTGGSGVADVLVSLRERASERGTSCSERPPALPLYGVWSVVGVLRARAVPSGDGPGFPHGAPRVRVWVVCAKMGALRHDGPPTLLPT